jgi:hypothetical protein
MESSARLLPVRCQREVRTLISSDCNNEIGGVVETGKSLDERCRFGNVDFERLEWFDGVIVCAAIERDSDMSFEEALALASRDEGFKATVYAMNTLLIHKGVYTQGEFQALFVEWVEKEQRRKTSESRRADASSVYSA